MSFLASGKRPPGSGTERVASYAAFAVRRAGWVALAWLLLTAVMNVAIPQLEEIAGQDSSPMVPEDAPSMQAVARMDEAFGNGRSSSYLIVAMERDGGLTRADLHVAVELSRDLRQQDGDVTFVQDLRDPNLRQALTSRDGEARYLLVGITGSTGAPSSLRQVEMIRDIVAEQDLRGLDVAVTGPTATVVDLANDTEHSVVRITIVTLVGIAVILLLIYRSVITAALILGIVGLGLGLARAAVAACGWADVFAVSTFSGSFLTAIVLGAGTDYAVFLVSRYHEQRRLGVPPDQAAQVAATKIGGVIAGSAVTVILATLCMAAADLGFFNTTGPAVAVSIAVNLLVSLTLTPAMIALAGRRGWIEPPASHQGHRWERIAAIVTGRPWRMLGASLVPLLALALVYPFANLSYDFREPLVESAESNEGYRLLDRHFPINEVLPDYVLIEADHDLRNPRDLALLERAAASVAQRDDVALVRGITRPTGEPITQASVGYQAGVVGDRLGGAADRLRNGERGAERLADGAGQLGDGAAELASGSDRLADGARQAEGGAGRLAGGSGDLAAGIGELLDGAEQAATGSGDLRSGMDELATGLTTAADQVELAVDGLGMAYDALATRSLTCGLDPACREVRDGLRQIWVAERDQLLPGLREAAAGARRLADGTGDLQGGLEQLRDGLARARTGADRLAAGQREYAARIGELAAGADQVAGGVDQLADGADRLAAGTEEVAASLPELRSGLTRAAEHLRRTGRATNDPAIGGFYLPPTALERQDFAAAAGLFLSRDGHTARYAVLGSTDAFDHEAMDRSAEIRALVDHAFSGTRLDGAAVSMTGMAATNRDLARYSMQDLRFIAIGAILAVFLVLLLLLRSPVAAIALMGTVVLSYVAAMGLSVIVWEHLIGIPLDWTVSALAFVILVAVGADYNLLLTKRMHEEAPDGSRAGIARATALTGGVITSAGVIFAASMFALMAGRVTTIPQAGFAIGCGLLLDTFVVRTLLVPALATILGPRLWWPQRAPDSPGAEAA